MKQISVNDLAQWIGDDTRDNPVLLDVREPWELAICQIPGSVSVPMHVIPARIDELDRNATYVCICHHGGRSAQVTMYLEHFGFQAINLAGGVHAWASLVDPTMARY